MKKIRKALGARTNTFEVMVDGLWQANPGRTHNIQSFANVKVMFTSDEVGETMSIVDSITGNLITVPYEDIERLVTHTRGERKHEHRT